MKKLKKTVAMFKIHRFFGSEMLEDDGQLLAQGNWKT